jgi:hypothetical protein
VGVHTAKTDAPAVDKLTGLADRMLHDASRTVVEHNAIKERVSTSVTLRLAHVRSVA